MTRAFKPRDFCDYPWNSLVQESNAEVIAQNIMKILRMNGDTWRLLSWDEYKAQRQTDGSFSEWLERPLFDKVLPMIQDEASARRFCPKWASVGTPSAA